ncbi:MAG: SIMPL domain-containing protein [Gemmatimonadaceae bacterium]
MRITLLASAVIGVAPLVPLVPRASFAQTQSQTQSSSPQVVVTGSGEARISPDRATVMLGVQSRAATVSAASADNSRRLRAILDTLKAMGLTNEQLATVNYSVSPEMQYSPTGGQPPRVIGYVVTNSIRADVHRLDDVGGVIDASLSKGANEVSSLQFYSSKADSTRRVAMTAAVADARTQAEVLARAAGGSLGPLIELSSTQEAIRPIPQPMMRVAATAAPVRTPIEAGEQTVTATVTVRWTFVSGR